MMWRLIKRTSYLAEELHPKDNLVIVRDWTTRMCICVFILRKNF